jgi:hypothetical protein
VSNSGDENRESIRRVEREMRTETGAYPSIVIYEREREREKVDGATGKRVEQNRQNVIIKGNIWLE